jgi:hypothetical protein
MELSWKEGIPPAASGIFFPGRRGGIAGEFAPEIANNEYYARYSGTAPTRKDISNPS